MESHLELDELAFHKPEDQTGLAGAHVPKKNLATQYNRGKEGSACQHPQELKVAVQNNKP
jgi:hypothetical protein